MFGLLLRLTILGAIVFGIIRGITLALRSKQRRRAEEEIRRELEAIRAGRETGLLDAGDQDRLTRAIYARCRQEGIEIEGSAAALVTATPANSVKAVTGGAS